MDYYYFYCTRTVRLAATAKEEFHLPWIPSHGVFPRGVCGLELFDPGALLVMLAADHFLPIRSQP